MNVSDALNSRTSVRAFLDFPVPGEIVKEILLSAGRSPSGGNLQPWHVWVLGGQELSRFKALMAERIKDNPMGEQPEYNIYPPDLKEPYKTRRFKNGEDLYRTIAIPREHKAARLKQLAKNFSFFGAPVGLFFAIDRQMEPGQWADLGMYIQSVMLLAVEKGLSTCPQEAWALWHKTVAEFIGLPSHLMLFCGMALGYMDPAHPINSLRADRADLSEFTTFIGF
ncbi:nitroreductase [Bradyrhizobium xenonodulans]|uniref:Nitroreductase n=1 Tax=Bradyrhizobium xenonodulans TaxID=2736875 RepID=A0ABY7MJC0_9BRAD|nr:nitroreductase [Bradyrhizobium xenonodulans]WBL77658.1 nitroreductase [Bradyrhizobium xenonodulans]